MSKMHASSFVPTNQSKLLLDTNILIHLFYPKQIYCIIFETALQSEHIFDGCYFCTHF